MRKLLILLMLTVFMVTGQAAPGWCDGNVSLKARPGLAGIYKVNRPVLIDVDVDNRGERITGRLALIARGGEERNGSFGGTLYGCEVDVPAGQKGSYTIVVPGEVVSSSSLVRLTDGYKTLAETSLEGAGVGGGMVVIPLAEKFLGSSLFSWLDRKYGGQVMVKYLPAEEFPDRSLLLRSADIIVADRESLSRLGAGQKKVLSEWVRLGGGLILSGESAASAGGVLEGFIPRLSETQDSSGPVQREPWGKGEIILSRQALEGIDDRDGKVWEEMGFASWSQDMLSGKNLEMMQFEKNNLADAGSYLPLAKSVGMPVLVALWLAYILVVGPGLFILLKRLRRSDLAWIMIPAVALLTAVGLFTLSPVNRLKAYLSQTMSTVEIIDGDLAEIASSGIFVLPRGGTLEVGGREGMLLEPLNRYAQRGGSSITSLSGSSPRVIFEGVEYGSMRQVYTYGTLQGVGTVVGAVFFKEDRLQGRIVNKTSFDLRDCRILVGKNLVELGSIPSGGARDLDEPMSRSLIVNSPSEIYGVGPQTAMQSRESVFMSEYASQNKGAGEVVFMGWSDSPVMSLKVLSPSGEGQEGGQTLIRQKLSVQFPEGPFRLPAGFIKNSILGLGGAYGERPEGLTLHNGSVKVTYDLRETLKTDRFKITAIDLQQAPAEACYTVELLNRTTSGWDRIEGGSSVISGTEAPKYVSGRGVIEIRLTSLTEKAGSEGIFRGITVEGVIGS